MVRRTATSVATTLYRLLELTQLRSAIRSKYLESTDFVFTDCTVGSRQAALIVGHMITDRAKWADSVGALVGNPVDAHNTTAAAVLLVPGDPGVTWALTYGMGFHLLEQSHIDPGFGQRLALRVADADQLSSLTRKTLDVRAKVDRSSIPSGDHLRSFGIGGFGELVTRLVATATLPGLSTDKPFTIRGADSLNIPLSKTPDTLLSDLEAVSDALKNPVVKDLEVLEQLVALKKGSVADTKLDTVLADALREPTQANLGTAWPHESVNENGTPTSFAVKKRGTRKIIREGLPTIDDLCSAVDATNVLDSLDVVKIQLYSDPDGQNPISTDIPLRKWIAFETRLDGHKYFLHDGRWYRIDNAYAAQLQRQVQAIFDRQSSLQLPPWPTRPDGKLIHEQEYNAHVAQLCNGLLLDRRLVYTSQNPRGFETCDILAPDGTLVHIKNFDASAPASHLFAQGANAAHTLSFDEEAREKFRALVVAAGGHKEQVKEKPPAIIFGIGRNSAEPFNAESLYSFSQVTLVRTVLDLEGRGIPTYVVPIERST